MIPSDTMIEVREVAGIDLLRPNPQIDSSPHAYSVGKEDVP